jgi:hypothetical protein
VARSSFDLNFDWCGVGFEDAANDDARLPSPEFHIAALKETDCVAGDAVTSETVSISKPEFPCDLQGDFQKLQGGPIYLLSYFLIFSRSWTSSSQPQEQGAFFGIAGKSSVELRM